MPVDCRAIAPPVDVRSGDGREGLRVSSEPARGERRRDQPAGPVVRGALAGQQSVAEQVPRQPKSRSLDRHRCMLDQQGAGQSGVQQDEHPVAPDPQPDGGVAAGRHTPDQRADVARSPGIAGAPPQPRRPHPAVGARCSIHWSTPGSLRSLDGSLWVACASAPTRLRCSLPRARGRQGAAMLSHLRLRAHWAPPPPDPSMAPAGSSGTGPGAAWMTDGRCAEPGSRRIVMLDSAEQRSRGRWNPSSVHGIGAPWN